MNDLNIEHLATWVGKNKVESDVIDVRQARLMAATLDHPLARVKDGEPLPPLWHWAYFLEGLPPAELGRDGHPVRGAFLPPVPLPNRMWAGGFLAFHAPVVIGSRVERNSHIVSVQEKQGKTGPLVFVKVRHELSSDGLPLITEDHDIVYTGPRRSESSAAVNDGAAVAAAEPGFVANRFIPTSTMLFRYSALTFNGHRIHYDADYCRNVEGYPDLVIHGPLNATLLANHARNTAGELTTFRYRGVRPAFLGSELLLYACTRGGGMSLSMALPTGERVMTAECGFISDASRSDRLTSILTM